MDRLGVDRGGLGLAAGVGWAGLDLVGVGGAGLDRAGAGDREGSGVDGDCGGRGRLERDCSPL